jgi:hypothetical protein
MDLRPGMISFPFSYDDSVSLRIMTDCAFGGVLDRARTVSVMSR